MFKFLVLSSFLVLLTISKFSFASSETSEAREWCLSHGGEMRMYEMLDERHIPIGIDREFCRLRPENEGQKTFDAETLYSDKETLAHRVFEIGCHKRNPAAPFCLKQGGLYSNWRDKLEMSETGFCAFADGSVMSDWVLCYGKKLLVNTTKLIRYYNK